MKGEQASVEHLTLVPVLTETKSRGIKVVFVTNNSQTACLAIATPAPIDCIIASVW